MCCVIDNFVIVTTQRKKKKEEEEGKNEAGLEGPWRIVDLIMYGIVLPAPDLIWQIASLLGTHIGMEYIHCTDRY